ncbi:hypothetical protein SAMN04489723_101232 [Algoriphagus aquimarinus]|uniref:Lipocalin-like domain-containing protein n=1 Tax=Algoriphagus aquimarinus TaxID=237018 RepID=A0A1I0VJW6_9BACT|nr:hypothetical protein SAMN04489723_101232 [Algoriphagus aquimarinus]
MKFLICILVIAFFSISCRTEKNLEKKFPQIWKLVGKSSYGLGGDSGFQAISDSSYFYVFKKDGTFLKTVGNETTSGTFQLEDLIHGTNTKGTSYTLTFLDDLLRYSCYPNLEHLHLNMDNLLVGGSDPCDGITLYFSNEK